RKTVWISFLSFRSSPAPAILASAGGVGAPAAGGSLSSSMMGAALSSMTAAGSACAAGGCPTVSLTLADGSATSAASAALRGLACRSALHDGSPTGSSTPITNNALAFISNLLHNNLRTTQRESTGRLQN